MERTVKEKIASHIDNEGLWYWIWQGFFGSYHDVLPEPLYQELAELSLKMEYVRKLLEDKGLLV